MAYNIALSDVVQKEDTEKRFYFKTLKKMVALYKNDLRVK